MKKFHLVQFTNDDGSVRPFGAKEMIEAVLNQMPEDASKGIPLTEQRKRFLILDKLEEAAKTDERNVCLEDAEYEKVKRLFGMFPWGNVHRDIVAVADAIEAAESFKIEAPKKG